MGWAPVEGGRPAEREAVEERRGPRADRHAAEKLPRQEAGKAPEHQHHGDGSRDGEDEDDRPGGPVEPAREAHLPQKQGGEQKDDGTVGHADRDLAGGEGRGRGVSVVSATSTGIYRSVANATSPVALHPCADFRGLRLAGSGPCD
jgi:hypothetical protein